MSEVTIAHYDRMAEAYWEGTRDHDVNQNYTALLDAIENDPPYSILDLGCGPGRDLRHRGSYAALPNSPRNNASLREKGELTQAVTFCRLCQLHPKIMGAVITIRAISGEKM